MSKCPIPVPILGMMLIIIAFSASCSRTPKGILSEEKMRQVLVDMQLAEAMINSDQGKYGPMDERMRLYQAVFDKYHLTKAEYDSSLIWYGKNLDIYMQIYEMAEADVKQRIEAIGDVKPEVTSQSSADSVDIWVYRKYYELSPDALVNTVLFDFQPDEPYSSGSIFLFGMNVWGLPLPSATETPIVVQLRAFQSDTIVSVKDTIRADGYHELMLRTISTKKVVRVYGYIRSDIRDVRYHKIYLDQLLMMKFRYGSQALEHLLAQPAE
ncbi:MAG: DUF4296 domain-containing protein [Tannerella sp.]|jgi:hypothetical protein|nr:DUF4296 domain-containing protein [Tannerella sp.]